MGHAALSSGLGLNLVSRSLELWTNLQVEWVAHGLDLLARGRMVGTGLGVGDPHKLGPLRANGWELRPAVIGGARLGV